MPACSMIILYVQDPKRSLAFYKDILKFPPVEDHPNFAMLPIAEGVMLGLWAVADVAPSAPTAVFGGELGITVANRSAVMTVYQDWKSRQVVMIQAPTEMDFGFTFTATDPDGHRLRVVAMRGENGVIPD